MNDEKYKRDLEETDEILDTSTGDSVEFWESKQRELVTSVVDYNLGALADLVTESAIDLSPKYQRRFRWDAARQSKLIESFLMNVPVPPIFLNEDEYGQYSVIDGKQRLTAITDFLRGRLTLTGLSIFSDANDLTYDDLPTNLKTVLRTRPTMRAVIILRQSDEDVKFEVFQRLNTGGVKLNSQEIRNSVYPGPLNDKILELSQLPLFHKLLGIKAKRNSSIYREMRDAEFVLRFFTFKDSWKSFSGGMKRHMDEFMAKYQRVDEETIEKWADEFITTLTIVDSCFGEFAFKRWVPEKSAWRKQVLASLFDAQMFACRNQSSGVAKRRHISITKSMQRLFDDSEFRRAIDAATNTPSYFRSRITQLRNMLDDALK